MGAIVALLTGPFATLIGWCLGILAVVGVVGGFALNIQHNAARVQAEKDYRIQMEQVVKNQQQFITDTKQLMDDQKKATDDLNEQIRSISSVNDKLDQYLDSAATAKQDRPASDILRETIKQLRGHR